MTFLTVGVIGRRSGVRNKASIRYRSNRSISVLLPEIDIREIDLSVDLRNNLVLISEIDTEINSDIDCWDTIERSISEISSAYYHSLRNRSALRNGMVGR